MSTNGVHFVAWPSIELLHNVLRSVGKASMVEYRGKIKLHGYQTSVFAPMSLLSIE